MATDVDEILGSYQDKDYTVRLVSGVCRVVPFAPEVTPFHSLAEALVQAAPNAKKPVLDRAKEMMRGDDAQRALWMFNALDTADSGISVFSGVRAAVNLYKSKTGERIAALETDDAQAADAVLKALALSYVIYRLFPGGPLQKVEAFRALKSGQAIAFYFAAIEVGLPFADNALLGGGQFVSSLYQRLGAAQTEKLAAVAGPEAVEGAQGVVGHLLGPIDALVQMSSSHLKTIAEAVTSYLPGAIEVEDKAAGVLATAADALPVYRYLGARLVAEACVARALAEGPTEAPLGAAAHHPASDEVKYTTKKPGKDEIQVPATPARRGFCFLFVVLLATAFASGLGGVAALAVFLR